LYLILLCLVWILSPAFSACTKDSLWCTLLYWTTESAGRVGSIVLVLTGSLLYTLRMPSLHEKVKVLFRTFLVAIAVLFVFAGLNEYVFKPALKRARPSHMYILEQTRSTARLDSLYALPESERRTFFHQLIYSDTVSFADIDKRVLDHWIYEAGSSFPSGHSFNAFLLAGILAFSMYHVGGKTMRRFYSLPLMWAVLVAFSRVALGAHSALDVSVGAALGLIVSHSLLYFQATQRLLVPDLRPDHLTSRD